MTTPSQPSQPVHAPGFESPPPRRPVRTADVVATIGLMVLLGVLTLYTSYFGLFLGMMSDPCGSGNDCNTDIMGVGVLVAVILPWVFFIAALIVAVVRVIRRKLAFWVPLAAAPLVVLSWFIGAWIGSTGLPSS